MNTERPVFVRGLSRSGGTLVVTILDAHPDIAMSYELYGGLLDDEGGAPYAPQDLAKRIRAEDRRFLRRRLTGNARKLVARARRGGLGSRDVVRLLDEHARAGLDFRSTESRLRFIAACCRVKQQREECARWGLKCNNDYDAYHAAWPDADFIDVVRDGRDVLASQLTVGSFHPVPSDLGRAWSNTHRRFLGFSARAGVRAHILRYEQLVADPERVIRALCEFLEIDFQARMLEFHREELTVFDTNHLSIDRLTKPIDASKVGRYQRELTEEQRRDFEDTARDMMEHFGYL